MFVNRSLALVRGVVGVLFIGHSMQKLFGLFAGPGMTGWIESVQKAGIDPAPFWAHLEAGSELGAGLFLLLGLLTPLAAAVLIGDMLVATLKIHISKAQACTRSIGGCRSRCRDHTPS